MSDPLMENNMPIRLTVKDFRSIASVEEFSLDSLSVFFGPNGAGKSSLLDALWLLHDCINSGVSQALSWRALGNGLVRQGSSSRSVTVQVSAWNRVYTVEFFENFGVLSEHPEELLVSASPRGYATVFNRKRGSKRYSLYEPTDPSVEMFFTDEVGALAFNTYVLTHPMDHPAVKLRSLLRDLRLYRTHDVRLRDIKSGASEIALTNRLEGNGSNLWATLRDLNDRRDVDGRYDNIIRWMRRAFPDFLALSFATQGASHVYCEWKFHFAKNPILAAHVADGMIQLLWILTALFNELPCQQILMFDEPDLSLHPWALFVLAEAIQDATKNWGRQVLLATHSPVLLSQFPEDSLYLMVPKDGQTTVQRLSDMEEPRELLRQYGAGYLYMSQLIGEQSPEKMAEVVEADE